MGQKGSKRALPHWGLTFSSHCLQRRLTLLNNEPVVPAPEVAAVTLAVPAYRKFVTQMPKGSKEIEWEIKSPQLIAQVGKDTEYQSSAYPELNDYMVGIKFVTDNYNGIPSSEWKFYFTRITKDRKSIGCILYLSKWNEIFDIYAKYDLLFVIKNKNKDTVKTYQYSSSSDNSDDDNSENSGEAYLLHSTSAGRGFACGARHPVLEAFQSPETESLTVYLTLDYYISDIQTESCELTGISELIKSSNKSLKKNLGVLYQNRENSFPDATLFMAKDEKELKVHKSILTARSRVFSAMFNTNMTDGISGRVVIEDISHAVMEIVLEYIYSGHLPVIILTPDWLKETNGISIVSNLSTMEDLVYATEKYDLAELKEYLNENIIRICTLGNAMELLKLSRLYKLEMGERDISEYIRK